ncbi:hypothetical protein ACSVIJ_25620 [Pseudomonas sp. NCHU5208]|uniref:hypothetical protein n=1 Tax=unclassified Pseudomonas TaxID=196821 RepID=UPI003F95CE69
MSVKSIICVITAALLSSCALTPPVVNFEGQSFANPQLKRDVTNMIIMTTNAKGCSEIEKIETSVIEEPNGEPGYQESAELWRAHGCNQKFDFNVAFKGDGRGGSYFRIGFTK